MNIESGSCPWTAFIPLDIDITGSSLVPYEFISRRTGPIKDNALSSTGLDFPLSQGIYSLNTLVQAGIFLYKVNMEA
ncbi:MAG: hypothetical protein ACK5XN_33215 [Bacteroidota bacterium]